MTLALVPTSPGGEDITAKETDRKTRLFDWCRRVLADMGYRAHQARHQHR